MAPANWSAVASALSVTLGWDQIHWLAAAIGRHIPGGEATTLAVAIGGVSFILWCAWTPPPPGLARQLLAIALIYWAVVITYSFFALSVLMPRILIPAVLPLLASIVVGVSSLPIGPRRRAATLAISLYALAGVVPWLWYFSHVPREDLRGLVENVQRQSRRDEVVIFIGGTDVALDVYWPEFKSSKRHATVNLLAPLAPQLDKLSQALDQQSSRHDVLITYRMDGYSYPRRAVISELLEFLQRRGLKPPVVVWEYNFFYLLRLADPR